MALRAKKSAGAQSSVQQQEAIEAGTYPSRVVQILDLGLQPQRPYKGEEKPPAQEMMITYEFLDEFCVDEKGEELEDKPRWLSETMPLRDLNSELAKSTKRYLALDPEGALDGDFSALVDTPCMVTVSATKGKGKHEGKTFNNVTAVAAMRSRDVARAPALVNPSKVFICDEPDLEVLGSLPDWLQEKIKGNLEFSGSVLEEALAGGKSAPAQESNDEEEDDVAW